MCRNRDRSWLRSLGLSLDEVARHGRRHQRARASGTPSRNRLGLKFVLLFITIGVVRGAILGCGAVRGLVFHGSVSLGR